MYSPCAVKPIGADAVSDSAGAVAPANFTNFTAVSSKLFAQTTLVPVTIAGSPPKKHATIGFVYEAT